MAYMMGGRAAEELVFHDPTTGASNDIEKATALALAMVTQYGMTERLGAIKLGSGDAESFLGRDIGHGLDFSEEVAAIVDDEVSRLISNAHGEAFDISMRTGMSSISLVRPVFRAGDPGSGRGRLGCSSRCGFCTERPASTGSDERIPSSIPPVTPPPPWIQWSGKRSVWQQSNTQPRPGGPRWRHGATSGVSPPTCAAASRRGAQSTAPKKISFAVTELDEAADVSRDGAGSMTAIDPIHFPERVREFDHDRVVAAVREILIGIGEDPDRDGLHDTPERVARAYAEMYGGLREDPEKVLATVFDLGHDELVLVKDIEVWSTCEHHLVPFTGVAHIGYIPSLDGKITGLSKLARLVDIYAKRPQVQERLTTQIADAINHILEPRGVIVVVECEHLCMTKTTDY